MLLTLIGVLVVWIAIGVPDSLIVSRGMRILLMVTGIAIMLLSWPVVTK